MKLSCNEQFLAGKRSNVGYLTPGLRVVHQFNVHGPFPDLINITEHGASQRREFFEDKF